MGGCGAYDANSLHLAVTFVDAPESSIQREQEISFNVGARLEMPSSVCARFTKFPRTALEFPYSSSVVSIFLSPWVTESFSQVAFQFFDVPLLINVAVKHQRTSFCVSSLLGLLLQVTWATIVNNQVQYLRLNPRPSQLFYKSCPHTLFSNLLQDHTQPNLLLC
jgi:hypothetical protein